MQERIAPLLVGAKLDHVAMVVNELDKTTKFLSQFLPGPYRRFEFHSTSTIYGQVTSYTLNIALFPLGNDVNLEVIETSAGVNEVHARFLRTRGEGVEHVGYYVDDLAASTRTFEKAGFEVILKKYGAPPGSVYIDTTAVGGLITELMQNGFKPDDPSTWPK
jgi:catechol 2,3-dioxygenase-like lactoylglutathione lyase family enzyme